MRHGNRRGKLNHTASHRKALFKNMANALIKHEQIKTTLPKAKALKSVMDKHYPGKKGYTGAAKLLPSCAMKQW